MLAFYSNLSCCFFFASSFLAAQPFLISLSGADGWNRLKSAIHTAIPISQFSVVGRQT